MYVVCMYVCIVYDMHVYSVHVLCSIVPHTMDGRVVTGAGEGSE